MIQPFTSFSEENKAFRLLSKYKYEVKTKEVLAGTLLGLEKKQSLLSLGLKRGAFLPKTEVFLPPFQKAELKLQKEWVEEFLVLSCKEDKIILSLKRLTCLKLWERFKQIDFTHFILFAYQKKRVFRGQVLNFEGLNVFLPNKHLSKYYKCKFNKRKFSKKEEINLQILDVKEKTYQIIGSNRLALLQKQKSSLRLGLVHEASVVCILPFGLFINFYGIKCLLHKSQLPFHKRNQLQNFYHQGDKLKVKVLYIHSQKGKVALSTLG